MSTATPSNKRRAWRAFGGFGVLLMAVAALFFVKHREQVAATEASTAAQDSVQIAAYDSSTADSTQAKAPKKKGFFSFLKGSEKPANSEDKTIEKEAVPVEIATVTRTDIPSFFTGTATIEAEQKASVVTKIAGTIAEILVEEGDFVERGQVLLQIDDAEEKARLQEVRVRAKSLQREFDRSESLVEKGLASDREHEDKRLLAEEAEARLLVGEITLAHTKVRAPFSGRITLRHVNVGENLQPNQMIFDIADFDPLLVRVFMPERQVDRIEVGQSVQVIAETDGQVRYAGHVRMIAPIVDTRSGTVKVTIELSEQASKLRIGAFVRVQITTDVHPQALVIPKTALIVEGGDTYVFAARADSVARVRVHIGYADEEFVEVLVGLQQGDRVVTVGQGGLKHGSHIRVLNSENENSSNVVQR